MVLQAALPASGESWKCKVTSNQTPTDTLDAAHSRFVGCLVFLQGWPFSHFSVIVSMGVHSDLGTAYWKKGSRNLLLQFTPFDIGWLDCAELAVQKIDYKIEDWVDAHFVTPPPPPPPSPVKLCAWLGGCRKAATGGCFKYCLTNTVQPPPPPPTSLFMVTWSTDGMAKWYGYRFSNTIKQKQSSGKSLCEFVFLVLCLFMEICSFVWVCFDLCSYTTLLICFPVCLSVCVSIELWEFMPLSVTNFVSVCCHVSLSVSDFLLLSYLNLHLCKVCVSERIHVSLSFVLVWD